jgi:predicted protein tyrosine phosphatase
MTNLTVTDLKTAPDLFDAADLFVSILDSDLKGFKPLGARDKHFVARFEDTEHPSEKEWMQMNREVRSILAWVKASGATLETRIVVHCHYGVSRSSALAWLILVMLGMDQREAFTALFKARPSIHPNLEVLAIGAKYLGLDADFMAFAREVDAEIETNRRNFLGYSS